MNSIQQQFRQRVIEPRERHLQTFLQLQSYVEQGGLPAFQDALLAHMAMWHNTAGKLIDNNRKWAETIEKDASLLPFQTYHIINGISGLNAFRNRLQDCYYNINTKHGSKEAARSPVYAGDATQTNGIETHSPTQLTATQFIDLVPSLPESERCTALEMTGMASESVGTLMQAVSAVETQLLNLLDHHDNKTSDPLLIRKLQQSSKYHDEVGRDWQQAGRRASALLEQRRQPSPLREP